MVSIYQYIYQPMPTIHIQNDFSYFLTVFDKHNEIMVDAQHISKFDLMSPQPRAVSQWGEVIQLKI